MPGFCSNTIRYSSFCFGGGGGGGVRYSGTEFDCLPSPCLSGVCLGDGFRSGEFFSFGIVIKFIDNVSSIALFRVLPFF